MQVSVIPGDQTVFTAASCYAFSTRPSSYNFGGNSSESIGYNTVPVSFASSGTHAGTVYTELNFEAVEWNSSGMLVMPTVDVFDLEVALYLVGFYS